MNFELRPSQARQAKLFTLFWELIGQAAGGRQPQGVGIPSGDSILYYGGMQPRYDVVTVPYQAGDLGVTQKDLPVREFGDWPDQRGIYSRRQRYTQYDVLEEMMPEVQAALQTYADEASSYDQHDHTVRIKCADQGVREELEWLFYKVLQIDDRLWGIVYNLCKYGDWFAELIMNEADPECGILGWQDMDPATMWRIQDGRGTLLEFQQSMLGPDYDVVIKDILQRAKGHAEHYNDYIFWAGRGTNERNLVRFAPSQMVHVRLGGKRKGFYPYGVSKLAYVWRIAYDLKLVQDAMLCYRLTRAPERRVYYVDVGQMPGSEVQNFLTQFKSGVKRQKIWNEKARSIDEDWNPMSVDDDVFLPIRQGTNTRVEQLPGAQQLGEIEDAVYFRKIFYIGLGMPPGYFEQTVEAQTNRLTLSQLDIRFAKRVLGVQKPVVTALHEIAERHLTLIRMPRARYEDLELVITPASDWQTLNKAELLDAMFTRANTAKQTELFTSAWILSNVMNLPDEEVDELVQGASEEVLRKAEVQAQTTLIAARAQAEIDRANAINQQRTQEEITRLQQAAPPAPGAEPPPAEGVPTPEELGGAFPPAEGMPPPEAAAPETPPEGQPAEEQPPAEQQPSTRPETTAADRELEHEAGGDWQ